MRWNPNAHDDATNEALAQWYQKQTSTPTAADRLNFLRQYREEQVAQNSLRNARNDISNAAAYSRGTSNRRHLAAMLVAEGNDRQCASALPAASGDPTTSASGLRTLSGEGNAAAAQARPETNTGSGDVSSQDVLLSALKPDQLAQLLDINKQMLGALTDQQRQQIESGEENTGLILSQLSPAQQEAINQLSQNLMDTLSPGQKTDLQFLNSGMLDGIDLQKRQAILQRLKETGGKISYDDLVRIGVYQPSDRAQGGFVRWLQNMDLGGGPAHFPKLLETEYKLNNSDTSFAQLDQEERQQREAEATMLLAMAAAPLADAKQYSPGDIAFGNNVYDNIESQGTQGNFKGSDFSWKPPTDAENPASTGTMPDDAAALHEGIDGPGDGSTKPYASSRPKYGSTQIDDVWNAHVDPETDAVQDPSGATIEWDRTKPRNGQWDMGHIPDQKYSDVHARYMNGEMSLDEFLDWYRNPQNYRPELPKTNRSRVYEGGGTYSK